MATTLGMGVYICMFQWLAIGRGFTPAATMLLVAVGFAIACVQLPAALAMVRLAHTQDAARRLSPPPERGFLEKAALAALALVALPALVAPLVPPMAFDELMYHLPYAREVARSGSLGIHEWLRYPWFPYNYNLLYAAALMVGDDLLPHFLHAMAGWLSVLMVYRIGVRRLHPVAAAVGAAIWLGLGDYSNALIDMGVALFVLAACVALWWWREAPERQGTHWLAVSAFLLGVAAGSKYQALTFLPLVAIFVAWRERRLKVWGLALACFLLPCIYWYARNAIATGDPFNPIGARIFGFTNWIPADYVQQVEDVRLHAALPSFLIWPVVLAPFSRLWRGSPAMRAVFVFCAYALVVWLFTSRYPRYLTAAYPLIALTAVLGWQVLLSWLGAGLARFVPAASRPAVAQRSGRIAVGLLLGALAIASVQQTSRKIAMVSPTDAEREVFLRRHVPGYAVMNYLRQNATGRVYQVALSEAIYYGPAPVWGDALGPWRYRDFITLPPAELARKLAGLGFEAIVTTAPLAQGLSAQPGFDDHFALMIDQDGARAYRILSYAP